MISRLKGILLEKNPPALLVDVQGVGYEVFAPMTSIYALQDVGEEVTLYTHFVVREDAQQLYGFVASEDRELFRILIKVNGVGPKMALAMMSGMEVSDLLRHVRSDNAKALSTIPGVGKKTAERLLVELRDKLASWEQQDSRGVGGVTSSVPVDHMSEAESALIALGYKPAEAAKLVSAVAVENADASSEELIRLALRAAVS